MVIRIHMTHIEIPYLTDSQKDYLSTFTAFEEMHETDGVYRLYGDRTKLYTALLLIAHRYSIEILQ